MSQPGIKNEKRTTQDAINMINLRYGNNFNTDRTKYVNADTRFIIDCNRCGKELKKTYFMLDKDDYEPCDYCRRLEENKAELIECLNQNFPENQFELLGKIDKKSDAVKMMCVIHNFEFTVTLENVRKKTLNKIKFHNPCKMCREDLRSISKPVKKISIFEASIEPVQELGCKLIRYTGYNAEIECQTCGKIHTAGLANYIKNGYGCPYCNIDKILQEQDSNKMRNYLDSDSHKFVYFEAFKKVCVERFGTSDFIVGEYEEDSKPIECNCHQHGQYFSTPANIKNKATYNKGCPGCRSVPAKLTYDEALNKVITRRGNEFDYSSFTYESYDKPSKLTCKKHGIFELPYFLLLGDYVYCCPICSAESDKSISYAELEIIDFLKENDIAVKNQDKSIDGKFRYDVSLIDYNLIIEHHGTYYHSFGSNSVNPISKMTEESKNIHMIKADNCESNNVTLFQIFSNEWKDKRQNLIWKSMILNHIKKSNIIINAKDCEIKEIAVNIYEDFINNNYLPRYISSEIMYGLYFNNKLIQAIGIKKHNSVHYITAICSKLNHLIVDGEFTILNHIENNYNIEELRAICNRRFVSTLNDSIYVRLGFIRNKIFKPSRFLVNNNDNLSQVKDHFKNNDVSDELIVNNNFRILYDAGYVEFIKKYAETFEYVELEEILHPEKSEDVISVKTGLKRPAKSSAYVKRFDNVDDRMETKRRMGYETFIKNLEEKFPNKFTYGTFEEMGYLNHGHKVKLICNNCNVELESRPEQILLNLNGCPKCSNAKEEKMIKLNSKENHLKSQQAKRLKGYERLIEITNQKWPNQFEFYPFEEIGYTGESDPLKIICKDHGEITIRPSSFKVSKYGCPECIKEGIKNTKQNKLK